MSIWLVKIAPGRKGCQKGYRDVRCRKTGVAACADLACRFFLASMVIALGVGIYIYLSTH